jgi:hypothetical protein
MYIYVHVLVQCFFEDLAYLACFLPLLDMCSLPANLNHAKIYIQPTSQADTKFLQRSTTTYYTTADFSILISLPTHP